MRQDKPNILVIMSDQHSRHILGCYGNPIVRTPNLDRLAAEGIRFDNAYCASPVCVPSRMSFMTSLHAHHNRVWNNRNLLASDIPTWAHMLGMAGYETALVGRMHFLGPDLLHGFEHRPFGEYSAGFPGVSGRDGYSWSRFPRAVASQCRESVEYSGRGTTHYQWYDEKVTEAACRFLKEKGSAHNRRPFAAVVGYNLPHCPFIAPRDLFDYYYERVDVPEREEHPPESIRRFLGHRKILDPPLSNERVRIARAAYFGLCEHADMLIGQVLASLDENGLSENTLVVYCSDHGEMAGEHGCWWKNTFYEGSVGIPLIVRYPGLVRRGSVSRAICNLIDLGPTFAALTGAKLVPFCEGRSLLGQLSEEKDAGWVDETYSEIVDFRGEAGKVTVADRDNLPARMIRSGRWKLWVYADKDGLPPALFDLQEDPDEKRDLGRDPGHNQVRNRLLARVMDGWDPQAVSRECYEKAKNMMTIRDWGRALRPESKYLVTSPPEELECDVEIL